MFGSLMTFASGVRHRSPSSAKASWVFASKCARILPEREMSRVSTPTGREREEEKKVFLGEGSVSKQVECEKERKKEEKGWESEISFVACCLYLTYLQL